MAVYKVPQDEEAEDKLLGPFSFRQFIYLVVVAISMGLAWGLGSLFIPLAIIPLPFIVFFGALALPLKKDQPMETYLAAVLSFYLKPRKRLWEPDGITSLIQITAPKTVEVQRTKDLSQREADRRFSYLADVVDSQGWSVRGTASPEPNNSMVSDVYYEAQQAQDIFDGNNNLYQSFDQMIEEKDAKHRQDVVNMMHHKDEPVSAPPPPVQPQPAPVTQAATLQPKSPAVTQYTQSPASNDPHIDFNPYPSIHQSVIAPIGSQPAPSQQPEPQASPQPQAAPVDTSTSEKPISPDIINLANNSDLSIETIAHEANRIHQKQDTKDEGEVVISLR